MPQAQLIITTVYNEDIYNSRKIVTCPDCSLTYIITLTKLDFTLHILHEV